MVVNHLSVDFEFWGMRHGEKVVNNCNHLIEVLEENDTRITFFVLGEIYEKYPDFVRNIADHGHEIAFHTYSHPSYTTDIILSAEIKKSQRFLDEFEPKGFRAPEMRIDESAYSVLNDNGFLYDSSIYGLPEYLPSEKQGIRIIPVTSIPYLKSCFSENSFPRSYNEINILQEVPLGSSWFVSILGRLISPIISKLNKEGIAVNLFIHSWQVDPNLKKFGFVLRNFPKTTIEFPYIRDLNSLIRYLTTNHEFRPLIEGVR